MSPTSTWTPTHRPGKYDATVAALVRLARDGKFRFANNYTYRQDHPCYWAPAQRISDFVLSRYMQTLPPCRLGCPKYQQQCARALLQALPLRVDETAISFADGLVYDVASDTFLPATDFEGSCGRYVDEPAAWMLKGAEVPTPALDALLQANQVPAHLMYCLMGRMLYPTPYGTDLREDAQHVLGVRVPGCDSDVETMLTCVVPKGRWCHLPHPNNGYTHGQRIEESRKAGGRLIVADVRHWKFRAINNLFRLLQSSCHAKAMHVVLLLPQWELPAGVREGRLKVLPFDFTAVSHCHSQQLRKQQAAVLVKCNRTWSTSVTNHSELQHQYFANQRRLLGLLD
jgi:hypothetical protein